MKIYVQFFLISLAFCFLVNTSAAIDEQLLEKDDTFRRSLESSEYKETRKAEVAEARTVQSTATALSDDQRAVLSKYGEAPEDKMAKYRVDDLRVVADKLIRKKPDGFQSPETALSDEERATLRTHGITFREGVEFASAKIDELKKAAGRLKGQTPAADQEQMVLDNTPQSWVKVGPTITVKKARTTDATATSAATLAALDTSKKTSTPIEIDLSSVGPERILTAEEIETRKANRLAVGGQLISGVKERTIITVTARASETAGDELIAKYKALGINIPAGTTLKKSTIAYLNMPTTLASLSKRPLMAASDITDETQLKKTINTITSGGVTEAERAELKRYNVKFKSSEGVEPVEGDMYDIEKTKKLAEAFNKVKETAPLREGESRPEVKIMTSASDPSEFMQRHLDTLTIADEAERISAVNKRVEEEVAKLKQIQAEVEAKEAQRKAQDDEERTIKQNLAKEMVRIKVQAEQEIAQLKRANPSSSEYDLKEKIKAISTKHSKKYVERKKTIVQSVRAHAGAILKSIGFGRKPQTSGAAEGSSQPNPPGKLRRAINGVMAGLRIKGQSPTKAH